ncbi:MAG: hypothetical protein JXB03_02170, partial [Spirochaetales bacterium]|nr:hypothetical protein [Spirochaetales bacterium]
LVAVHYAYMSSGQEEYHVLEVFDLSAGAWTSVDAYRETGSLGSLAGLIEYRWENYSRSFGINFAQDMIVLYGAGAWTDRSAVRSLVFGFNNNELSGPAVYTADLPYANDENYFFIEPFFNGTLAPLFRVSYEYGAAAPVQADAVFMYDSPAFTLPPRVYGGDKGSGVGQFDFFTAQLIQ